MPRHRHHHTLVRVATLASLVLAVSPVAKAANDALCGTTISASIALTEDVDCTGYTGVAITIGAANVTIDGRGFKLHAPDSSTAIAATNQDGVTVQDLTVEGWCTGTGIRITGGRGHLIDNVQANGRSYGLDIVNAVDIVVHDFTADASAQSGMRLTGVTGTVALENLALTNGLIGLELVNMAGPRTIDATAIASLALSDTGIELTNVDDFTFSGLTTLNGAVVGLDASDAGNSGLTFSGLDVSGANGIGTGLWLGGGGHTLTHITANRRAYGVRAVSVAGLAITTLTANGNTTAALSLETITGTLTLSGLALTDSAIGLNLNGFAAPTGWTLDEAVILSVAKSDSALQLANVQNATVEDLTLPGVTFGVHAGSTTNANLTLRRLDLSAPYPWGTGLNLSGSSHTVEDITVNGRQYGVQTTVSNLSLKLVKARNTWGRAVEINTHVPTTLEDLRIDNALVGLFLDDVHGADGDELVIAPYVTATGGVITELSDCGTSIELVDASYIVLDHLVLDGRDFGLDADSTTNAHITVQNVDASRSDNGIGNGLDLYGPGHVLTSVTARGREYGVVLRKASGAAVTDLDASGNTYGLTLASFTTTEANPVLSGLTLQDNAYALYFHTYRRPFTISPAQGIDASRSNGAILLDYSWDLTFEDLVLPNEAYGIHAQLANQRLTFDTVDVSGHGRGTGLQLGSSNSVTTASPWGGPGHTLIGVTANRRESGVRLVRATAAIVTGLTAMGCGTGLYVEGVEAAATSATDLVTVDEVPPALSALTLTDNTLALWLLNWRVAATLDGVAQAIDVTGSATGIQASGMRNTTFRHWTLPNRTTGFLGWANNDLRLEDVDASGPGVGVGVQLGTTAYGNVYQRLGDRCVLQDVTADRRAVGVDLYGGSAVSLAGVNARNGGVGLRLMGEATGTNPSLKNLDLGGNATGLSLSRMPPETPAWTVGPYDASANGGLGAGAIANTGLAGAPTSGLAGTDTGISISNSDGVVFDGLTLDGADYGINANSSTNKNLVFRGLDLSGTRRVGDGLSLAGSGHRVEDVRADHRAYGVRADATTDLALDAIASDGAHVGISLVNTTLPLTLRDLTLTGATLVGLSIQNLAGTEAEPFGIGPYVPASSSGAITSLAGSAIGIQLSDARHLHVHDLTLDNRVAAISAHSSAANANIVFEDLVLEGPGHGDGLSLRGTGHRLQGVSVRHRSRGIFTTNTSSLTVNAVTASDCATGAYLGSHTGTLSLAGLGFSRCGTGLLLATVAVAPAIAVDALALPSQQHNDIVVSVTGTGVTIDGAALGLTAAGNAWRDTTPAVNDPDCGAVLTASSVLPPDSALTKVGSDFTLTADLSCPSLTGAALTLGQSGVTLDGANHEIFAPHATTVVHVVNNVDDAAVNNIDISGSYSKVGAAGVRLTNGARAAVSNVTASYRERGVFVTGTTDLIISGLAAVGCDYAGLDLVGLPAGTRPLDLTDLALTGGRQHGLRLSNVDGTDPTDLTGATPLVLGSGALTDLRGNGYSLTLDGGSKKLTVDGVGVPPLDGWSHGVYAAAATNVDLTFQNLDLSGFGGRGIELNGSGHTLTTVTANGRTDGVWVSGGSGLTITGLQVDGAGDPATTLLGHGLYLTGLSDAPALTDLSLTNADIALHIATVDWTAAPLVLGAHAAGAGAITSLADSTTGITLNNVKGLQVQGASAAARLALSNPTAIDADQGTNAALGFEHLDVSGARSGGSGLLASATGLTITDVLADDRATGVQAGGTQVAVTGVRADRATLIGVRLDGLTHVDAGSTWSVKDITARDATEAMRFDTVTGSNHLIGPYSAETGIGMVTDLTGSVTALNVVASTDLVFDHLVLTNPSGIAADSTTNARLTFQDLTLATLASTGEALYLTGSGHKVQRVTSAGHDDGLYTGAVTGLVIDDFGAVDAVNYGVAITSATDAPSLEKLRLEGCATGLYLGGFTATSAAPLVIDPWNGSAGVVASLADSQTGLYLSGVKHVTVTNFTGPKALSNPAYGLRADAASNANLTVTNVDVSGGRPGQGLSIKGNDHTLTSLTANRRAYGVMADATKGLSISGLTASGNSVALDLRNNTPAAVGGVPTHGVPTLAGINVANNRTGLHVYAWTLPWTLDNASGWLTAAGSWTGIRLNGVSDVTVRNFTGANKLANTGSGINAQYGANARLAFEHVDLSGGGLAMYDNTNDLGCGLRLQGTDCVVEDVVASERRIGLHVTTSSNLRVTSLRAERCAIGALLGSFAAAGTAPTLTTLNLGGNGRGLYFQSDYRTPTVVNAATALDVSGSRYGVTIATGLNKSITLDGLTLNNPIGVSASGASGITVKHSDLSGSGRGRGLDYAGDTLTLDDVTASDREYGAYVTYSGTTGGGHDLRDLRAARASVAALYLNALYGTTPPLLSGLALTDSGLGLQLAESRVGPLLLDSAALASLAGNQRGLQLDGQTSGVTVRGLHLHQPASGISAGGVGVQFQSGNTFEDLDLTGQCRGTGIAIRGERHTVTGLTVARRAVGASYDSGDKLTVADSAFGANVTGLSAGTTTFRLDAVVTTSAYNTVTDLWINRGYPTNFLIAAGDSVVLTPPGGGAPIVRTIVASFSTNGLRVEPALDAPAEAGTLVQDLDTYTGAPRLTLVSSDICANATGVNAGVQRLVATGDYWRSSTGPTHASVPGGTGDKVTATGSVDLSGFSTVPTDTLDPYCNQAPVADAGAPQTVCEGDTVSLDATGSSDPDVEPLHYRWSQVGGTAVTLAGADTSEPTFTAPHPASAPEVLTFEVMAADDQLQRADKVQVTVELGNAAPTAAAGDEQTVNEGDNVSLDGGASVDPEGTALTFAWVQTDGPLVTLSGADTATPSFTAPTVGPGGDPATTATVTLALTVTDSAPAGYCGGPKSATATVGIIVNNIDKSPVAAAGGDQDAVEGDSVTLDAGGSSDPDGDALSYAWTQLGGTTVALTGAATATPSFTAPAQAELATEVLTFSLTVSDGFGGTATDEVRVAVHDACVGADGDGDGTLDCLEGCPSDPDKTDPGVCGCGTPDTDSDGDSTADCVDGCPDDPGKTEPGVCDCGTADTDRDSDGTADCDDLCPDDPGKTEPGLCGCSIVDTDSDSDGTPDCSDGCDDDPLKIAPGVCSCGTPDTDGDVDGLADCLDGCVSDPLKGSAGLCGCGVADTDADGDGTPDCLDLCPSDPQKAIPGVCGCGVLDVDADHDGTPDCAADCSTAPDGTLIAGDISCGVDACGAILGDLTCQGGVPTSSCDPAYLAVPDTTCDIAGLVITYAIVFDLRGAAAGTIRCTRTPSGVVTCDEDSPGVLHVYDGLYCPGVTP